MESTAAVPTSTRRLEDAIPTGDAAALDRLYRWGGTTLLQKLVQLFLRLAPDRIAAIRAAAAAGDARATEAAAHLLGSGCAQLGGMRMQRISLRIERLAGEGNLAPVPPLASELEDEFARLSAWLTALPAARERVA